MTYINQNNKYSTTLKELPNFLEEAGLIGKKEALKLSLPIAIDNKQKAVEFFKDAGMDIAWILDLSEDVKAEDISTTVVLEKDKSPTEEKCKSIW